MISVIISPFSFLILFICVLFSEPGQMVVKRVYSISEVALDFIEFFYYFLKLYFLSDLCYFLPSSDFRFCLFCFFYFILKGR